MVERLGQEVTIMTGPLLILPAVVLDDNDGGEVGVHVRGLGWSYATCTCGWTGRRRHLRASAEQDAWAHAIESGCDLAFPLVNR
jgi:hypothetical protein